MQFECLKKSVADDPDYKEAWQLNISIIYVGSCNLWIIIQKKKHINPQKLLLIMRLRIDKDFARAYFKAEFIMLQTGIMQHLNMVKKQLN